MKFKVLNRSFVVLLCFCLCVLVLPVRVFAGSGELVEVKPNPIAPASTLSKQEANFLVDQALNNYLPKLSGYAKTCARATLSAALKLYQEKNNGDINGLQYFLKSVALSARSLTAANSSLNYLWWRSAGDTLMSVNEALIDNGVTESGVDWDKFSADTALTAVERFIDPDSGKEKETQRAPTAEDVTISSDVFKEYVNDSNTKYTPKNAVGKMSYKTDSIWQNSYGVNKSNFYEIWELYRGADGFIPVGGGNEMYCVFFYTDPNGSSYYSQIQLHFTFTTVENWSTDYDVIDYYGHTLTVEYWDMVNSDRAHSTTATIFENCPYEYFRYYLYNGYSVENTLWTYKNYTDFCNGSRVDGSAWLLNAPFENLRTFYKSDLTTSIRGHDCRREFKGSLDNHKSTCCDLSFHDFGYVASLTPIETVYHIDTSKIPDNYYVTVNGDTVYDYSITNPETGQSDTINNYITNNYTYLTNPDSGSGSGSGSGAGGNITVGGKVDVGGSVGVDINVNVPDINVNINQSNVGGGGNSYDFPDTDVFSSYYDEALDESSGFRQFLGEFFSFLPTEIIALLGIGLTLAILARIFGR